MWLQFPPPAWDCSDQISIVNAIWRWCTHGKSVGWMEEADATSCILKGNYLHELLTWRWHKSYYVSVLTLPWTILEDRYPLISRLIVKHRKPRSSSRRHVHWVFRLIAIVLVLKLKLNQQLTQQQLFHQIVTVKHRPLPYGSPGKEKPELQQVVDFGKVDEFTMVFLQILMLGFNTIGTTKCRCIISKNFIKIDHKIFPSWGSYVHGSISHWGQLIFIGSQVLDPLQLHQLLCIQNHLGIAGKDITEMGSNCVSIFRPGR